jgi:hypothetical protein
MSSTRWRLAALVATGLLSAGLVPWLERLTAGEVMRGSLATRTVQATGVEPAVPDPTLRPPPGRWRLAPPRDLQHVLLPVSQILISHRDADLGFSASGDVEDAEWLSRITPRAGRTRAQARALAEQLLRELRATPAEFARLAARHSDDPASRARDGRMGLLVAASVHPVVLDALADLSAGQVSDLMETSYGFHVWQLRPAPQPQQLSGERMLIRHSASAAPATLAQLAPLPGSLPSREQALAIAHTIRTRALARPEAFLQIAREQGSAIDPTWTGELGAWSSHDVSAHRAGAERELEELSRLAIGAVSEPVESRRGIQLLRRTEAGQAAVYAYQGVFFRYDPGALGGATSERERALEQARQAIRDVAREPSRFAELQQASCCAASIQWTAGFVEPELAAKLAALRIGEVAAEPHVAEFYVVVLRRVAPTPAPSPQATAFELPRPGAPDLAQLVEVGDGAQLAQAARELAAQARLHLHLDGARAASFDTIFAELATDLERTAAGPQRRELFGRGMSRLQALLGPAAFQRCVEYMNAWATARLLQGPAAGPDPKR